MMFNKASSSHNVNSVPRKLHVLAHHRDEIYQSNISFSDGNCPSRSLASSGHPYERMWRKEFTPVIELAIYSIVAAY
jgi:hypothetical protein